MPISFIHNMYAENFRIHKIQGYNNITIEVSIVRKTHRKSILIYLHTMVIPRVILIKYPYFIIYVSTMDVYSLYVEFIVQLVKGARNPLHLYFYQIFQTLNFKIFVKFIHATYILNNHDDNDQEIMIMMIMIMMIMIMMVMIMMIMIIMVMIMTIMIMMVMIMMIMIMMVMIMMMTIMMIMIMTITIMYVYCIYADNFSFQILFLRIPFSNI